MDTTHLSGSPCRIIVIRVCYFEFVICPQVETCGQNSKRFTTSTHVLWIFFMKRSHGFNRNLTIYTTARATAKAMARKSILYSCRGHKLFVINRINLIHFQKLKRTGMEGATGGKKPNTHCLVLRK